jgi:hypothetical protein
MFGCQVDRLRPYLAAFLAAFLYASPAAGAGGADGLVWEARLDGPGGVGAAVERLFAVHEEQSGISLRPGLCGRAGLKVNTRNGAALTTPLPVLEAAIAALEKRGFAREDILIVDASALNLRNAGLLPYSEALPAEFKGCPVVALDRGEHFDEDWFYDSPLPPVRREDPLLGPGPWRPEPLEEGSAERRSYLPEPLLFEVDFWINLPVAADSPVLGIDGALANATLWNVGNSGRFLANPATASAAVAEIAAIPELREGMRFHLVSLERYQFIGGPGARSLYTRSEPLLWMSADPVALDRLLLERLNNARRHEGFPEIEPLPAQLPFAESLGLGTSLLSEIRVEKVTLP